MLVGKGSLRDVGVRAAPFAEGETHRGEHASGRLAEGEGRSPR